MPNLARPPADPPSSLSMKLGGWFEANATGWGVVAIPVALALLLAFAVIKLIWL